MKFKRIFLLIVIFLLTLTQNISMGQNESDNQAKPFKLKKKNPTNSDDIPFENFQANNPTSNNATNNKPPQKNNGNSFTNYKLGALVLIDLYDFGSSIGVEFRGEVDTNLLTIPLEWTFYQGDFILTGRPMFHINPNRTIDSNSLFATLYFEQYIKNKSSENSYAEIGGGAGFSNKYFLFSFWLTSNLYQGTPTVQDILGFRTRLEIKPDPFYAMMELKIGTAILKTSSFTTSSTTFNVELEFGYRFWRGMYGIVGMEGRTDNLGAILDSQAEVSSIDSAIKTILKIGILYHFK